MGAAILLLAACSSPSPQAKNALQSLERIQARTNRAVWYDTYHQDLAQAQKDVRVFLATPQARADQELAQVMEQALFDYELAGRVWDLMRLAGQGSSGGIGNLCIKRNSSRGRPLLAWLQTHYPELAQQGSPACAFDEMEVTRLLKLIWEHAAGLTAKARKKLAP